MQTKWWKFIAAVIWLFSIIMLDSWFMHQPSGNWWRDGLGFILLLVTLGSFLLAIFLGVDLVEN